MFLLHGRLSGVDGFADAAQLNGEERKRRGVNLRSCSVCISAHTIISRWAYNRPNDKYATSENANIDQESKAR